MFLDVDTIVNKSVTNGRFIYGRSKADPRRPWQPWEREFLRNNANHLPMSAIAEELDRSPDAVKIKIMRYQIGRRVKLDDELTVREVGMALGKCGKSVKKMVDRGLFPARELPYDGRTVHVTRRITLYRWATRPENWPYFKVRRVVDPHLKRLICRAQALWGDKWLRAAQIIDRVALTQGVTLDDRDVNRAIRRHGLADNGAGVNWDNWHIRQTAVDAFDWASIKGGLGKPGQTVREWSAAGDDYMVLALAVGVPLGHLATSMAWNDVKPRRAVYRLDYLRKQGQLAAVAEANGVEVYDGGVFADWKQHRDRFPGLVKAMGRFGSGRLTKQDRYTVWGVLLSWARRYAVSPEQQADAMAWSHRAGATEAALLRFYQELLSWGVDPLESGR